MKIVTVIGARPQFIKASVISNLLKNRDDIEEVIFNTGQHFDKGMCDVFFNELNIPEPKYNLAINSCSHGKMTGRMMQLMETLLMIEQPDMVLVYGDTNSTLAGALTASKLHIPIAHVEAGLRSYDKRMPEEINRILTDHVSTYLFCPTIQSVKNLLKEGFEAESGIKLVGDIMYDLFIKYKDKCKGRNIINKLPKKDFCLMTIHREENTTSENIYKILSMVQDVSEKYDLNFVFPVHPRTRKLIKSIIDFPDILFADNMSYTDMLCLEMNSKLIVTDSGGVQKEACWCGVNCITIRNSTEWVETLTTGWNTLVGLDENKFKNMVEYFLTNKNNREIPDYGDGKTGEKIIEELLR